MNAFSAAMDRIFGHPDMGLAAVWIAGGPSEERPIRLIRLIRRAPDRITEFGSARILSETLTADIRVSDLPDSRPGVAVQIEDRARVDYRADLPAGVAGQAAEATGSGAGGRTGGGCGAGADRREVGRGENC
ncbi:hypothetical protein H1S04_16880 [Paracoccus sp. S1E-3]|nr:hypothetical protein [Paracoccus sp. S1E-3]